MRPMSPLAPFRKRTLSAGIAFALVVTVSLLGLRGVAHADLGDEPRSKSTGHQVDDSDNPKDLDKKPATEPGTDLTKKAAPPPSDPFYTRWQFYAIAGAVVVGALIVIFGGRALAHQLNGGDVRPCNMDFEGRCFGEGH